MSAFLSPISIAASTFRSVNFINAKSLKNPPCWKLYMPSVRRSRLHIESHSIRMTGKNDSAFEPLVVMVNGLPGRMAAATAENVLSRGLILADEAMTGAGMGGTHKIGETTVTLVPPDDHASCLQRLRQRHKRLIIVDYTHPTAANRNVELYAAHGISFVIGTTGGDANAMYDVIQNAGDIRAVVAPNMAKQIVAFQAMIDFMATKFPGAFDGYTLTVKESHQSTKADTSGTAKAVVSSFTKMGLDFAIDRIEKIRDPARSIKEMNVPEHATSSGHAYHTYHLTSPDGTVNFEFQHNVAGRGVYAAGTVDAVQYLDARLQTQDTDKRVFSMIDVLQSGSMS